jgi:hypothetical protein
MKLFLSMLLVILAGCAVRPLKPGFGVIHTPSGVEAVVKQPENPKNESKQDVESRTERVSPSGEKVVTTEKITTVVGAAQKDTGREVAAKLRSLSGVVWVGVILFLFGVASAVYPPLKLIVGSVTTSAACAAAGLALIFLPSLLVGHELLILGVSAGVVALWFVAHRHGSLKGSLDTLLKDVKKL